jgi:hypothetical protein
VSSDTAADYQIAITCVGIPETLERFPLPVEIVSQDGSVRRAVMTLTPGWRTLAGVEGPGSYLIRSELPSGRWITETVTVPDQARGPGEAAAEVTLDIGAEETASVVAFAEPVADAQSLASRESLVRQTSLKRLPDRAAVGLEAALASAADPLSEAGVSVEYGLFEEWSAAPSDAGTPPGETLLLRRAGSNTTVLPGSISLTEHPGWASNSKRWRPLLVRVELPSSGNGTPGGEALVVWPPSPGTQPLSLIADPSTGQNRDAPPLLGLWDSGDPAADALFAFVQGGALDSAREAAPLLIEQAESYLMGKATDPIRATLAAYALFKVGRIKQDWTNNLADWFPHLPDGAILYGWCLNRAGKAEAARDYFHTALTRGVPMYSKGIRYLRDGLKFLQGLYPGDAQVQADATRAYRIAAAANPDSEVTCLRLGIGIGLRWI